MYIPLAIIRCVQWSSLSVAYKRGNYASQPILYCGGTIKAYLLFQNLGRRFGIGKMLLSPLRLLSILWRWFCRCCIIVYCRSHFW